MHSRPIRRVSSHVAFLGVGRPRGVSWHFRGYKEQLGQKRIEEEGIDLSGFIKIGDFIGSFKNRHPLSGMNNAKSIYRNTVCRIEDEYLQFYTVDSYELLDDGLSIPKKIPLKIPLHGYLHSEVENRTAIVKRFSIGRALAYGGAFATAFPEEKAEGYVALVLSWVGDDSEMYESVFVISRKDYNAAVDRSWLLDDAVADDLDRVMKEKAEAEQETESDGNDGSSGTEFLTFELEDVDDWCDPKEINGLPFIADITLNGQYENNSGKINYIFVEFNGKNIGRVPLEHEEKVMEIIKDKSLDMAYFTEHYYDRRNSKGHVTLQLQYTPKQA